MRHFSGLHPAKIPAPFDALCKSGLPGFAKKLRENKKAY
jgi:hypothetical protein